MAYWESVNGPDPIVLDFCTLDSVQQHQRHGLGGCSLSLPPPTSSSHATEQSVYPAMLPAAISAKGHCCMCETKSRNHPITHNAVTPLGKPSHHGDCGLWVHQLPHQLSGKAKSPPLRCVCAVHLFRERKCTPVAPVWDPFLG